MMQVIKKWRVTIYFDGSNNFTNLYIHDNFYSNMLQKLQLVSFDVEPIRIQIEEIKNVTQEGVFHQ